MEPDSSLLKEGESLLVWCSRPLLLLPLALPGFWTIFESQERGEACQSCGVPVQNSRSLELHLTGERVAAGAGAEALLLLFNGLTR